MYRSWLRPDELVPSSAKSGTVFTSLYHLVLIYYELEKTSAVDAVIVVAVVVAISSFHINIAL